MNSVTKKRKLASETNSFTGNQTDGMEPVPNQGTHVTVGIIVIGDEILNGSTLDVNSNFFCRELYSLGVKVSHISVIPDCLDTIAEEVAKFSDKYTHVLTSGGIGPTHDDVTYAGVAKAFNEELVFHTELSKIMKNLCQDIVTSDKAIQKMCYVPQSAKIHPTKRDDGDFIPIVSVRNVYLFPGIPSYLRHTFMFLRYLFFSRSVIHQRLLYLNVDELTITDELNDAVEQFGSNVQFGSYPDVESKYHKLKLSLESDTERNIEEAEGYLRSILPHNCITNPSPPKSKKSCTEITKLLQESVLVNKHFICALKESILCLEQCFESIPSFWDRICLSFNGGKDCTVLLHIITYMLYKKGMKTKLKAFYVHGENSFPEVEEFVEMTSERYGLELSKYKYPIKDALSKFKNDHPKHDHILMGTRSTDPGAATLMTVQKTDDDWPAFTRVNVLLSWTYHDIWKFLKLLDVPYCSLYDKGYTSLGCKHNTVQNPKLKAVTSKGKEYYKPAYLLKDSSEEREGRQTMV